MYGTATTTTGSAGYGTIIITSSAYATGDPDWFTTISYDDNDAVTGLSEFVRPEPLTRKQRRKLFPVWPWRRPPIDCSMPAPRRPAARPAHRARASGQASAWRCRHAPWGP